MPIVPCCSQCDSTRKLIQLVHAGGFLCQDCLRKYVGGIESERDDLKSNLRDAGKLLIEGRSIMDELEGQRDVLLAACKNYVRQYALVNKKVMGKTAHMIHDAVAKTEE